MEIVLYLTKVCLYFILLFLFYNKILVDSLRLPQQLHSKMCVANELFAANNFAELLSHCLRHGSRAVEITLDILKEQTVLAVLVPESPRYPLNP